MPGLRERLVERFGGLTAFTRNPAEGLREAQQGERSRDEIVIRVVAAERLQANPGCLSAWAAGQAHEPTMTEIAHYQAGRPSNRER